MPKEKKYQHGTPYWIDLATADLAGARAFYAGSFSWEYVDEEMGEMDIGVYSMAKLEASAAAAIYESGPGQIRSDEAATWNVYVSVDDVDAVVERVAANGGAVLADSRDVVRAGRVAVIVDPTGCVTTLWEPDEFVGCGVMSEVGAFAWSEHLSTDRAASVRFFEEVVGVETATADRELTPSHPSKSTPPVGRPLPRFHRIHRLPRVQRPRAVRYSCSLRRRQGCSTRRRLQKA